MEQLRIECTGCGAPLQRDTPRARERCEYCLETFWVPMSALQAGAAAGELMPAMQRYGQQLSRAGAAVHQAAQGGDQAQLEQAIEQEARLLFTAYREAGYLDRLGLVDDDDLQDYFRHHVGATLEMWRQYMNREQGGPTGASMASIQQDYQRAIERQDVDALLEANTRMMLHQMGSSSDWQNVSRRKRKDAIRRSNRLALGAHAWVTEDDLQRLDLGSRHDAQVDEEGLLQGECRSCGAPLPAARPGTRVGCEYCGAVAHFEATGAAMTEAFDEGMGVAAATAQPDPLVQARQIVASARPELDLDTSAGRELTYYYASHVVQGPGAAATLQKLRGALGLGQPISCATCQQAFAPADDHGGACPICSRPTGL